MAHKKGAGSSRNGRESASKRLGVKLFGGQEAKSGNIIVRQRGTRHNAGVKTLVSAETTLCLLLLMVRWYSRRKETISLLYLSLPVAAE
jgi:large subunit ribosomal protein L27